MSLLEKLASHWPEALQVVGAAVLLYWLIRRFGTADWARFLAILAGLCALALAFAEAFDLVVLRWLVIAVAVFFPLALMIAYQPELRRTLADLGSRGFLFFSEGKNRDFPEHLADAVRQLGAKRFGALFAIERRIELRPHLETGVRLDALLSTELILTLFHPKTELHDGGLILREGRVVGAGCLFPVSQREIADRSVGLRHRAGIGITEESDAIAVIVSEETGDISIAHGGAIERHLEPDEFRRRLLELLELGDADDDESPEPAASASDPPLPKNAGKTKSGGDSTTLLSG